ncbi:MAG: hypothetical protein SFV32_10165 [Opitutaceae bacterium]|nr:hypothetical protein [Opitutaceae bacterium]
MKNLLLTLGILAAVAALSCGLTFHFSGDQRLRRALQSGDAFEWMRVEFKLSDQQLARIKAIHAAYTVECEEHCRRIQEAADAKRLAMNEGASPESVAAAQARLEELRAACESAIAAHVRRCAAEMSGEDGKRYLALVLPKIADFDHKVAPNLRLESHAH